ncbi:MAG: ribose 5-phosphate isomerase B [Candidatus Woesearchaeota archaeon]|nr:ribose 5-phosphate isomerase B [Candidatus Woesearchaeota archaeon]
MLFIGADHAGFKLKEFIKNYFIKEGISFADVGALKEVPADDYPDFALKLSKAVAKNKGSQGILICGTGVGMCIAANKVKGIKAANVYDEYTAKFSRLHNDANVICLRGWEVDFKRSLESLKIWLNTKFDGDKRLVRRINKIKRIENTKQNG